MNVETLTHSQQQPQGPNAHKNLNSQINLQNVFLR